MFGIEPCEGCKQRRERIMVALTGWLKNPVPPVQTAVPSQKAKPPNDRLDTREPSRLARDSAG